MIERKIIIEIKILIREEILKLVKCNERFLETKNFNQHGTTSVFKHSYAVAILSCKIALYFNLDIDYNSLIRGALLHDYFLYDWHDKKNGVFLHGFVHPRIALNNAKGDFEINKIEENIILRHMFPLVPFAPKYKEAWIVCLADKLSASAEFVDGLNKYKSYIFSNLKKAYIYAKLVLN